VLSNVVVALEVTDPDDGTEELNVFHDGIIYTKGDYSYQGNPIIYGSLVCDGNYHGGGNPAVYYNAGLSAGEPQPLSTRARPLAVLIE